MRPPIPHMRLIWPSSNSVLNFSLILLDFFFSLRLGPVDLVFKIRCSTERQISNKKLLFYLLHFPRGQWPHISSKKSFTICYTSQRVNTRVWLKNSAIVPIHTWEDWQMFCKPLMENSFSGSICDTLAEGVFRPLPCSLRIHEASHSWCAWNIYNKVLTYLHI